MTADRRTRQIVVTPAGCLLDLATFHDTFDPAPRRAVQPDLARLPGGGSASRDEAGRLPEAPGQASPAGQRVSPHALTGHPTPPS